MQRIRTKIVAWLSAFSILTVAVVGSLALPAVADGGTTDGTWSFEDEMTSLDNVSEKTGNWEVFPNHTETGLSVVGRKDTTQENTLIYTAPDGQVIDAAEVRLQIATGFVNLSVDFALETRAAGSQEWVPMAMTLGTATDINATYESAAALPTVALPAGTEAVRLTLKNGIAWTLMIDAVRLSFAEKGTTPPVTDEWDLEDDLANWDKIDEKTGNWDLFASHTETGLSVAGRKDTAQDNTLIYTVPDGQVIDAAEVRLQIGKGFVDLSRDFALDVRVAGSDEWVPVTMTLGEATSLNDKFETAAATPSAELPADTEAVRLTLKNDVPWTLMIDAVRLGFAEKGGTTPPVTDEWDLEDDLANWNLVDDRSLGWQQFASHAETGLSVIGRSDATLEAFIAYRPENKNITDLEIALMVMPDFFVLDRDIRVSVRKSGSEEWSVLTMAMGDPTDIPNATNPNFKSMILTPAEALAADIAEVKIELLNDVLYTPMLDKVSLKLVDSDGETDVPGDNEKEYGFVDEMESFDQVKDKSDNWELFADHAETHLSVAGKTNARSGYLTYGRDGQTITDFAFDLQAATAHFNLGNHILVKVRCVGSEEWETITMKAASIKAIDGQYSSIRLVPQDTLPENIEEVQLMLYNDVPWTLMVDRVLIDYAGDGDDRPNTDTGVAFPAAVCLLAVLSGGAAVKFSRKRNKD